MRRLTVKTIPKIESWKKRPVFLLRPQFTCCRIEDEALIFVLFFADIDAHIVYSYVPKTVCEHRLEESCRIVGISSQQHKRLRRQSGKGRGSAL